MNGCEKQPWRLSFAMALAGLVLVLGAGVAAAAGGQGTPAFVPGEHVRLTDTNRYHWSPMVSPDGRWVVFYGELSPPPYARDIYKLSLEDLSVTRLTFEGRGEKPSFSRDGASIFYSSMSHEQYRNIWKMKSDGTDQTPVCPPVIPQNGPNELPDGRIVYHCKVDAWYWGICIMNADGTGQTTLPGVVADAQQPRVSPDGRYVTYSAPGSLYSLGDVYIYDLETFTERRLTYESASQGQPNFSPDGNWIVYASNEDGGSYHDLWIMDTSGGNRQQLTFEDGAHPAHPAFLPDGSGIVYTSSEGGAFYDLWLLRLAVDVAVDIKPDTLNPRSYGRYMTAYIELPEGYDVADIDVGSVCLAVDDSETFVPAQPRPVAIGDYDKDRVRDLMVKFDRGAVQALLTSGETTTVYVGGVLIDGTEFLGSDTVRVLGMVNVSTLTFLEQVVRANETACGAAELFFDSLTSSSPRTALVGGKVRQALRLLDALLRRSPEAGLGASLREVRDALSDLAQQGVGPSGRIGVSHVQLYRQARYVADCFAVLGDCYDFERRAWLTARRTFSSDCDLSGLYQSLDIEQAQIGVLTEALEDFKLLAGALHDPQRAQQLTALADDVQALLLGLADYAGAERSYVDSW